MRTEYIKAMLLIATWAITTWAITHYFLKFALPAAVRHAAHQRVDKNSKALPASSITAQSVCGVTPPTSAFRHPICLLSQRQRANN